MDRRSGTATRVAAWWSAHGCEDEGPEHDAVVTTERVDLRSPALHAKVDPADGGRIDVVFPGASPWHDAGEGPGPSTDGIFVRPGGVELSIAERGGPTEYRVLSVQTGPDFAFADLVSDVSERGSSPVRKRLLAPLLFDVLIVCVENGVGLSLEGSAQASGGTAAPVTQETTWVARAAGERTAWVRTSSGIERLLAAQSHFHLVAGCGSVDADRVERLLAWSNHPLHQEAEPRGSEPLTSWLPRVDHALGSATWNRSRDLRTDDPAWGFAEPDRESIRRPIERSSMPPA